MKNLFNVEEIEAMAKKQPTPAVKAEPAKKKAELLRGWWDKQSGEVDWKDAKAEIETMLVMGGHPFNEKSDYLAFRSAGKKQGKIADKGGSGRKGIRPSKQVKQIGIKEFIGMLPAGVDTTTLAQAIELINNVGNADTALELAKKWETIVDKMGGDKKARDAVDLIG